MMMGKELIQKGKDKIKNAQKEKEKEAIIGIYTK